MRRLGAKSGGRRMHRLGSGQADAVASGRFLSDKTMSSQLPISRRKTYELVAERLLEEIGAGRLKPGDRLPTERELTQSYGVGRSSVREALRMLESQGLVAEDGP